MPRRSLRLVPTLICVLLLGGGLLVEEARAQQEGQLLDGIIAVVGNHPILRSDVEAMATAVARGRAPTTDHRRAALEELITQNVVAEHALRDTTVVVREDDVTMALEQRTRELVRQLGSEAAVEELYGRSLAQLREDHRSEVRRQLLAQTLQRRKYQGVRITPQEVRQWFNRIPADSLPEIPELVRIAQIVRFPAVDEAAREHARETIEALRDSIVAGEPIEAIARRHSEDPGSRAAGGRYDGINLHDLVPEFGAVAGTLEPGQLSHVFETQFGFHIMRLNSRRGDLLDFNHVLISVDETRTDPGEAIRVLEAVRDSVVRGGASFARLAREYSEDQASAARGGNVVVPQTGDRDLRYEALSAEWRSTIDALEVGQVSAPAQVTLLDGRPAYHIVLLQRREPAHRMSLESDYVLAEEFALDEKRQRAFEKWLGELRQQIYVACFDDRLCPPADGRAALR